MNLNENSPFLQLDLHGFHACGRGSDEHWEYANFCVLFHTQDNDLNFFPRGVQWGLHWKKIFNFLKSKIVTNVLTISCFLT